MGRHLSPGGRTVKPFKIVTGAPVDADEIGPQGVYALEASTTYYYVFSTADCPFASFQITGYTSAAVITSATFQDCNHEVGQVPNHSVVVGEWIPELPPSAYVAFAGTGWSAGATGVVAAAGSGVGGATWHLGETGVARSRFVVVVGATGGNFRGSAHGKE